MAHDMIEEGKFWRMVSSVFPYSNLVPEISNPLKTPGESTTTPTIDTAISATSNATTTDHQQQYKRQSKTQLEGDLKGKRHMTSRTPNY